MTGEEARAAMALLELWDISFLRGVFYSIPLAFLAGGVWEATLMPYWAGLKYWFLGCLSLFLPTWLALTACWAVAFSVANVDAIGDIFATRLATAEEVRVEQIEEVTPEPKPETPIPLNHNFGNSNDFGDRG
jgi:hypothetical protein